MKLMIIQCGAYIEYTPIIVAIASYLVVLSPGSDSLTKTILSKYEKLKYFLRFLNLNLKV